MKKIYTTMLSLARCSQHMPYISILFILLNIKHCVYPLVNPNLIFFC